ncbi:sensor domain-containing diguanylate cyclase [Vibrio agarivorans]|uniref:sensor domain-containing diguanylate cyclase n=1 Tax=Vibrio agarivorans TaxID=153622 RepID=UPI0025B35788|nr:diguanylate cyclase [Vibrio agarivorans]MDN3662380.1 diguanylate cyclase [Vibrio agarivorans]
MKPLRIIAYSTVILLLFIGLLFGHYYHRYNENRADNIERAITESQSQLNYIEREYYLLNERLVSSSRLLAENQSMYDYILEPNQDNRRILEQVWASVAAGQKWYRSIRAISLTGQEVLKVNYDRENDRASPSTEYRNVEGTDLFDYLQSLQNDQFGTWQIEFEEAASGVVSSPVRPVMKIMTPVSALGERVGYLVLDFDVTYLTNLVVFSPDPTLTADLISHSGYYVAGQKEHMLFGEVFPSRSHFNFATMNPLIWQKMQESHRGYYFDEGTLYVFTFVGILPERALYAMIEMPPSELESRAQQGFSDLLQEALFVLMLLLVILLPITFVLMYYYRRDMDGKLARAALNGMSAVLISDKHNRGILVNQEFQLLTGYSDVDIKDKKILDKLLGQDSNTITQAVLNEIDINKSWEGELLIYTRDGGTVSVITRIQPDYSPLGELDYYIISFVDISERKKLEERLRALSELDDLTGLWNRRKFEHELTRSASIAERYSDKQPSCLALIDIDHFKRVNDEKGHDEGDRTIRVVGQILTDSLRVTDFVSRIGGEEFALLMPHTTLDEAQQVLERILVAVSSHQDIDVTISAGFTDMTGDRDRSYKWADIALYQSKANGRNRVSRCLSREEYL